MAKRKKKPRRPAPEQPRLSQFLQGLMEGRRETELPEWLVGRAQPWLQDPQDGDSMRRCGSCGQARRDHCGCGACVLVAGVKCAGWREPA